MGDAVSFMLIVLKPRPPLFRSQKKAHSQLEVETGQAGGKDRLVATWPSSIYVILAIIHFLPLGVSVSTL